jgi:protein MpaA
MGDGPDLYVVIGTIHGDEPVGAPLVRQLAKWLEGHPDLLKGKQVALIPIANPDGLVHGARLNVRGRDINRNWPSDNWIPGARRGPRPLSEPETRALFHLIGSRRPHRIITIHQPLVGVNWDGPAGRIARKIARVAGLRRLEMRERRGSIGTYAGRDRDIPVLTLELPQKAAEMRADQLWRRYGKALKWSISWPDPPPRAPPRQPSKNLSAAAVSNP